VQLIGTLFFNVTTLAALDTSLSTAQAHSLVWVPDAAGSVCFLAGAVILLPERVHARARAE
jgi:hypothetical protein